MFFLGERREMQAMRGEQGLVGGDHRLAMGERRFDAGARRPFGAADQFDEKIDRRRGGELDRIVEKFRAGKVGVALLRGVPSRYARQDDAPPGAGGQRLGLPAEQTRHRRADGAEPRDADAHDLRHCNLSGKNGERSKPRDVAPCA